MLTKKQKAFLAVFKKKLGNVSLSCEAVGINRRTYYDWKENNPEFKELAEDNDDFILDFAESALHKQMNNGSTAATIFFLKTKGKKRGYVEHQQEAKTETKVNIYLPDNNRNAPDDPETPEESQD